MAEFSSNLLLAAFILYLFGTIFFAGSIRQKNINTKKGPGRAGKIGFLMGLIGFLSQLGYFVTRWLAAGHAPVSNLFEFITFFGMVLVGAFLIMYSMYKNAVLGLFALPIALIIIGYASMFPTEIQPLVPSLKSYWLYVHVTTTAAGQALLSISFIAGVIYLLKDVDQSVKSRSRTWLEILLYLIVVVLGFIMVVTTFSVQGYEAKFQYVDELGAEAETTYPLPALVGPNEGVLETANVMEPLMLMPDIVNASRLNTVIWSFLVGTVLYAVIRLLIRRRVSQLLKPLTKQVNLDLVDEISYRSVLIGFPVFTLGALIFAMIWAQEAWSRFWGWDPKEVWALITWLFYAAYLHLRLSKGWHGKPSAWLAVVGFAIIIFNLIFINLVIAGLHSYA